jgi:hypothetical protein
MPKGNVITKKQVVVPAITAALVLMMAPAMLSTVYAQNPHFNRDPNCSVDNAGNLDCSGRINGLGNVAEVDAFLVADVSATFGCDNPGKGIHIPPGQPTESTPVTGDTEPLTVRNGRADFDLSIAAPEAPDDLCKENGWTPVLAEVTYTNIAVVVGGDRVEITDGPISGP